MTESEAISIASNAIPGTYIPVPGNPSVIGWYMLYVFSRGGIGVIAVDPEGNIWAREDEAWKVMEHKTKP